MKFFMNRHYSTAQKIIGTIEKKIISALAKHPTNEFTDKDKLSKELSRSLSSVQKELIESNNDAFQSQLAL